MPRMLRALWPALILVAASAGVALAVEEAHEVAQHGEHHGLDIGTLALQLLNFGVLLFILVKFGGPALGKMLRERHETLKADLADAARVREAAKTRLIQQEQRIANLEKEIAGMRAAVEQDARRERELLLQTAEEKATRLKSETTFQVDQMIKDAELRVRAEVARNAVRTAEALLRKAVSPQDEQRLAQAFVSELGANGKSAGGAGEPPRSQQTPRPLSEGTAG